MNAKQKIIRDRIDTLKKFQPTMLHAWSEKTFVKFHAQIISDYLTIEQIALSFMDELATKVARK